MGKKGIWKVAPEAAEVPSSKVTDKLPCSPWRNSRIVAAFVSRILSMINLPRESMTATEIVAWWTSIPIYFSWLITALLSVSGDANNHNLPQSGRLLFCVHLPGYDSDEMLLLSGLRSKTSQMLHA